MISIRPRTTLLTLLLGLAVPALAVPLVVRASGPSAPGFKPGQRLQETAPLVLRSGDRLTILDAQGTRSFTGPGSFRLDTVSAAAAPVAFTALLTQKPERRARIGAVRSVGAEADTPVPPGVWAIDSGTGGTVCVLDPTRAALWRADPTAAGTRTLARKADGKAASVAFAPGQAVAAWPATLVAAPGDQFRVTGTGAPTVLTVRVIAPAPASLDLLGAALLENGCESQFDRLAANTAVPDR